VGRVRDGDLIWWRGFNNESAERRDAWPRPIKAEHNRAPNVVTAKCDANVDSEVRCRPPDGIPGESECRAVGISSPRKVIKPDLWDGHHFEVGLNVVHRIENCVFF
jgi:hypothetical protein